MPELHPPGEGAPIVVPNALNFRQADLGGANFRAGSPNQPKIRPFFDLLQNFGAILVA
jgi:hypothetical protein